MLTTYYTHSLAGRTPPGQPSIPLNGGAASPVVATITSVPPVHPVTPPERPSCRSEGLIDVLQSLVGSGIEAGCFFAANAVALTALARGGRGALTGWESRAAEEPETYLTNVGETATAAAVVALPMGVALLLTRWLVKPVVGALGQALSGRTDPEPTPTEMFFPAPSRHHRDGRPRSHIELEAAWNVVKKGRKAVLARQAQFAPGGIRDLACELAHPLAFALQGVALDYRDDRPGLLTVGGITLATAGLATGLAETILDALKTVATFPGIDENGEVVDLHLFGRDAPDPDSTVATRMKSMPASVAAAMRARYRAMAGGADGARPAVLALAAELARSVTAVLVMNGVTALIDPLDAQFGRSADKSQNAGRNAGLTLLSATVATTCFRLALKLLDRQRDQRTSRRQLAQRMKIFHAGWMRDHAPEVAALHDHVRHQMARGMHTTTADCIVFDELVEPMMKAFGKALAAHRTLHVLAAQVHPGRLRSEMLADHGNPDVGARNTRYVDRLLQLPVEFPEVYAVVPRHAADPASVVLQMEADDAPVRQSS